MSVDRMETSLSRLWVHVRDLEPRPAGGRVVSAIGTVLRALLPDAFLGEVCRIAIAGRSLLAEVVGLDGDDVVLAPLDDFTGLASGAPVERTGDVLRVPVGDGLIGRVVDGLGRPIDGGESLASCPLRAVAGSPPAPMRRRRVDTILPLGVRAIDGLMTCGDGQRIGIYGEPGGGKSTLLGSLVRNAEVDNVVVALVGERGREVRDFIEEQMDATARARTVTIVATSDRPAIERLKASLTATTIAEAFRDEGRRVLLVLDSVTRYARALREIGLAAGEPPARRGFPPSVMAELPRLLERAGPGVTGSITAFYTVLVEGDGSGDPVAEETRAILDGHIVLSPKLAASNHYPAIDVLASRSRVMNTICEPSHRESAGKLRALLQTYDEIEFLVQVGEYKTGADPRSDAALSHIEAIRGFLRQDARDGTTWKDMLDWLARSTR